jgi:hypothetical protein
VAARLQLRAMFLASLTNAEAGTQNALRAKLEAETVVVRTQLTSELTRLLTVAKEQLIHTRGVRPLSKLSPRTRASLGHCRVQAAR